MTMSFAPGLRALRLLMLLPLVACAAPGKGERTGPAEPVVQRVAVAHAVHFGTGLATLGASEMARLNGFLKNAMVRPGDRVGVEGPAGEGTLAGSRAAALARWLAERGLQADILPATGTGGDTVRVTAYRVVAVAPDCPSWVEDPAAKWQNRPWSNFGCATAANLAAMVVRPTDLETGRKPSPAVAPAAPPRGGGMGQSPGNAGGAEAGGVPAIGIQPGGMP